MLDARRSAALILQLAVMGAIVATLVYWPAGVALATLLALFGVPLDVVVTFDGALNRYAGLLAWWTIVFVPSLVYAAFVLPWDQTRGFPRQGGK